MVIRTQPLFHRIFLNYMSSLLPNKNYFKYTLLQSCFSQFRTIIMVVLDDDEMSYVRIYDTVDNLKNELKGEAFYVRESLKITK